MHDTGEGRIAVLVGQNASHVVIRRARMDDERKASALGSRDMDTQRLLLHLSAVGCVVIVQTRFTNADEFRMLRQSDQFVDGCHRLVSRAHWVSPGGVEDRRVCLGNGADGGFVAQACADGHHAGHTGLSRVGDDLIQLAFEIREIQMAMAIGDFRGGVHLL